jgi:hypothetical protein
MNTARKSYLFISRALSSVGAIFLIPVALQIYGEEGWLTIATLQSLAVMLSPLVQMHWSKFGGLTILENDIANVGAIIIKSIVTRLISLTIIVAAAVIILSFRTDGQEFYLLACSFFAAGSLGLTNEWYYLARKDFKGLLLKESVPRFILSTMPLLFLHSVKELTIYFLLCGTGNVLTSFAILRRFEFSAFSTISDPYTFYEKAKFTAFQFIGFLILFSPVPIVNFFNFAGKFEFTLLERFFRMTMNALLPITQIAHSQILSGENKFSLSRKWYQIGNRLSKVISVAYFPALMAFLYLTNSMHTISGSFPLTILFLILIICTFRNRFLEEIFVLNLKNITLINRMQLLNSGVLIALMALSIVSRNSFAICGSLIATECARTIFMERKIKHARILR